MKKTLTINLSGYAFNIDSDAYEMLNIYLDKVSAHLADNERDEIMKDIEARIADLFAERLQNRDVVDGADVAAVIDTLGQPEQFDLNSDPDEPQPKAADYNSKNANTANYTATPTNRFSAALQPAWQPIWAGTLPWYVCCSLQ